MPANHTFAFGHLYKNASYSDVEFIVKNRYGEIVKIPAHRFALMAQSPVFESMFYGDLKDEKPVEIVDACAEIFGVFLQFFYMTEVEITSDIVAEILQLADKYLAKGIIASCETFMQQTLSVNVAYDYHRLSLTYNDLSHVIRDASQDLLCQNPAEVFKNSCEITPDSTILASIIKLDSFVCKEVDIFNGVMAWAKASLQSKDLELSVGNIKEELGDIINGIRFPIMSLDDLLKCFQEYPSLLSQEQCLDIIGYVGAKRSLTCSSIFSTYNRFGPEYAIQFQCAQKSTATSSSKLVLSWQNGYKKSFQICLQVFISDGLAPVEVSLCVQHNNDNGDTKNVELMHCDDRQKRMIRISDIITFNEPNDQWSLTVQWSRALNNSHCANIASGSQLPDGLTIAPNAHTFISDMILKETA